MKKLHLLGLVLFLSYFAQAKIEKESSFTVISDVFDASLPKGKYKLEGKVLDESGQKHLPGALYKDDHTKLGKTTKAGRFTVLLDVANDEIEFYKNGYKKSYFESYPIKEQHRIRIQIKLASNKGPVDYPAEKPVIYCYAAESTAFSINIQTAHELQFVYPAFDSGNTWNVELEPNQLPKTTSGIEVPYLFWESKNEGTIQLLKEENELKGEILRGNEITAYLEKTLSEVGFNAQEKTDFITYWAPRIVNEKYLFVQFLQNNDCQQFASYTVNPQPESFNRFFMVFTPFNEYPEFLEPVKQKLVPIQRSGFHFVEWGGISYPAAYLEPAD